MKKKLRKTFEHRNNCVIMKTFEQYYKEKEKKKIKIEKNKIKKLNNLF